MQGHTHVPARRWALVHTLFLVSPMLLGCSTAWRDEVRHDNLWRYVAEGPDDMASIEDACKRGRADACEAGAFMYDYGIGVRKSAAKTGAFNRKLCELGRRECFHGSSDGPAAIPHAWEVWESRCETQTHSDAWKDCKYAGMFHLYGQGRDPPDVKRGRGLLQKACDLERGFLREELEHRKAKGLDGTVYPASSCWELGKALLLGSFGDRGARHGLALLREECDKQLPRACAFLGLASELGLGGEVKDVRAAVERYAPLCTLRTYYADLVAGRPDPAAHLEDYTYEPFACYRLGALMLQGRGITGDIRVAAHLHAEGCLGSLDFNDLACAPAAALFLRYGLTHKHPPSGGLYLVAGPIGGGGPWINPALPEQMARDACAAGSVEGCRVLRWLYGNLDDHHLAFDMREE